jgi:hypothetical protein
MVIAMCHHVAILATMFLKPTKSGGHTYLQLVESYRNEAGQPHQRTVASLGRLDEVGGRRGFAAGARVRQFVHTSG